jgi:hypothetical protein
MENSGAAKQNVQQSTQSGPIMLIIERSLKFDSQDLRPSSAPYKDLMETDRISRDEPDPEHFYDGDEGVVYCRSAAAASRAEETLKRIDWTAKRVDCMQTIPSLWRRKMLCELAKHKELKQNEFTGQLWPALILRWFDQNAARQITSECLEDLVADSSIIRHNEVVSLNPQKHPRIWEGYEQQRGQEILLANIHAQLPHLRAVLEGVSSHWGYEDPIYRFYHQSFKVDRIWESTGDIVGALKELSDRPFNKWFRQIIDEGGPSHHHGPDKMFGENGKLDPAGIAANHDINASWLRENRPKLEAFFHAKFMLEMAVKYGSQLKEPPKMLPSGWAALLYLYDLR